MKSFLDKGGDVYSYEKCRSDFFRLCSILENYGDDVEPIEYYEELFAGVLEKERGDGFGRVSINFIEEPFPIRIREGKEPYQGKGNTFGELEELVDFAQNHPRAIMGNITYFGASYVQRNAKHIVGLTIDFDRPYIDLFQQAIAQYWSNEPATEGQYIPQLPNEYNHPAAPNYRIARPTFITASGTGLHLTFQFNHPYPLFKGNIKPLNQLKKLLTRQVWWSGTSKEVRQIQPIWQQYTVIGSKTSFARQYGTDEVARVYRIGEPWDPKTLFGMVGIDVKEFNDGDGLLTLPTRDSYGPTKSQKLYGAAISETLNIPPCTAKKSITYGEWIRNHENEFKKQKMIINREQYGDKIRNLHNRGFYMAWLGRLWESGPDGLPKVQFGTRYYCIENLVSCAMTSKDVTYEELERDAYALQPFLNSGRPEEPFTVEDVKAALKRYGDPKLYEYSREVAMSKCGVLLPETKRNGRKQEDHLAEARMLRDFRRERNNLPVWNENGGRPAGSGTKKQQVAEWRASHPDGKKIQCERETGLSRHTVLKWWDAEN